MAHAPDQFTLPELPTRIKDRLVSHRASDIEENLRSFEAMHPGLLGAMIRTINMLEAESGIENITVDYDEEDVMYPATIWARSSFSLDERWSKMGVLGDKADHILQQYPDLVLVAIL